MQRQHIVMILSNPFVSDPRVEKEARDLTAAGHSVTVLAWDRRGDCTPLELRRKVRIRRFAVPASFGRGVAQVPALLRFYRAAWRELRRIRCTVLHCHDLETLPFGAFAARRLHVPMVFDAHEPSYFADARRCRGLLRAAAFGLETALLRRADHVLVTNEYQLRRYRRMRARRLSRVANWPDRALLQAAASPAPPPARPLTIGRIGALYFDMGIEELVRAHQMLRREFPELRLLLAGAITPAYAGALQELLRDRPGVELRPGYAYAELPRLYAELDLAVLPQKRTPWFRHITPTKFFEALAFGVPVLSTDVGGLGDLLRAHGCGSVLERVTPEHLVASLRPWLRDAARRRRAGSAGRALVEQELNWDRSRESLLQAYRGLPPVRVRPAHRPQLACPVAPRTESHRAGSPPARKVAS